MLLARNDRLGLLLARHGQVTNVRIREALGVTGLTTRHGMTLMHLADTGPVSQQALIELLGVDPSVLVAILNDLEGLGLAQRRRDPADRRRHIVEIMPAGADMLVTIDDAIAAVERDLFADLSDDEVVRLRELLGRIRTDPDDPACAREQAHERPAQEGHAHEEQAHEEQAHEEQAHEEQAHEEQAHEEPAQGR